MKHLLVGLAVATAGVVYAPRAAQACGGFFCNRGSPMDQAGEKIVFGVEDDGTTVAHIQIAYQGSSEAFAWILPLPSVPEISVGTDALFDSMEAVTRPQFQLDYRTEGTCRSLPTCPMPDYYPSHDSWGSGGWADAAAASDAGSGPSVDVHLRAAVGPYDAAVISSTSSAELFTWLADNGYDIPDTSRPIVDEYIARENVFVALRLLTDRGAGEIQPIVLRFTERQPCIPIRLTAIATVPDMPITAWVLADRRTVPYNYMSLEPPVHDPGLWTGGAVYEREVTEAVDDAGGRAFVTDYAGATPLVRVPLLPSVDDLRTQTDPKLFVEALVNRGFNGDSQLLGILMRHIPPPDPSFPQDFYNCLANGTWCNSYDDYLATLAFDPDALATDLTTQVIAPRQESNALIERHPYLTRLFTTMSAEDMTEDPVFVLRDDMPTVNNVHRATLVTECSSAYFEHEAPQRLVMADGTESRVRSGTRSSADAYCMARTGYPAAESPVWGPTAGGGGLCSASSSAATPLGTGALAALSVLGGMLFARRRRRG